MQMTIYLNISSIILCLLCRKVLTVAWEYNNEEEIIADHLYITFHGVAAHGDYVTNYYVIRDIQLLAK